MTRPAVETRQVLLSELHPYENNPRDNTEAIEAVKNSIETFGFLVPIVVDADNVIVSGHTRYEASKLLELEYVPCIYATHLTEAQIRAFRVIDNKVSEIAGWDYDLLAPEIAFLSETGLDMEGYGWTTEELDCLSAVVAEDCLDVSELPATPDGVNVAMDTNKGGGMISRDPKSVRVAIGEINFFVDIEFYREWAHEVRKRNGFDMKKVVHDLASSLGLEYRPFAGGNAEVVKPSKTRSTETVAPETQEEE